MDDESQDNKGILSEIIDDIRHTLVEEPWFGRETTGAIDMEQTQTMSSEDSQPSLNPEHMEELDAVRDQIADNEATASYADYFREAAQNTYEAQETGSEPGYSFSLDDMQQNLSSEADLGLDQSPENDLDR